VLRAAGCGRPPAEQPFSMYGMHAAVPARIRRVAEDAPLLSRENIERRSRARGDLLRNGLYAPAGAGHAGGP
jgi:hypothetical protein